MTLPKHLQPPPLALAADRPWRPADEAWELFCVIEDHKDTRDTWRRLQALLDEHEPGWDASEWIDELRKEIEG